MPEFCQLSLEVQTRPNIQRSEVLGRFFKLVTSVCSSSSSSSTPSTTSSRFPQYDNVEHRPHATRTKDIMLDESQRQSASRGIAFERSHSIKDTSKVPERFILIVMWIVGSLLQRLQGRRISVRYSDIKERPAVADLEQPARTAQVLYLTAALVPSFTQPLVNHAYVSRTFCWNILHFSSRIFQLKPCGVVASKSLENTIPVATRPSEARRFRLVPRCLALFQMQLLIPTRVARQALLQATGPDPIRSAF